MDLSIAGGHPFILNDLHEFEKEPLDGKHKDATWAAFRIGSIFEKEHELLIPNDCVLPDLTPTHFHIPNESATLPSLEGSQTSTAPSVTDSAPPKENDRERHPDTVGLWELPDVVSGHKPNELLSWDQFTNEAHEEPRSAYLSEAGDRGYDLALRLLHQHAKQQGWDKELPHYATLTALFELGLGRDSAVFRYNEKVNRFESQTEYLIVSGFSHTTVSSVISEIETHGLLLVDIKKSMHGSLSKDDLRTWIAFKSAVHACLQVLERRIGIRRANTGNFLELCQLFQMSTPLLTQLRSLIDVVSNQPSDGSLVSQAIQYVEGNTSLDAQSEHILNEIVRRTAAPWFSDLLQRCGIGSVHSAQGSSGNEVEGSANGEDDDTMRISITKPLSTECSSIFAECISGLQMLRDSAPNDRVFSFKILDSPPEWETTFAGLERVQGKAFILQQQLQSSINVARNCNSQASFPPTVLDHLASAGITSGLEDLLSSEPAEGRVSLLADPAERGMAMIMEASETSYTLTPSLSSTLDSSLWPLITAQNSLVQHSCLELLFQTNKLRAQLMIQHQYQLFDNGDFTTRLASALFDPNLSSHDRKSARSRITYSTGLRLETRSTWPPATSEVRLALMGLLTESFRTSAVARNFGSGVGGKDVEELPGDLSFSIRDLTDKELDLCRDPYNIEALDFLRISYRPNTVIRSVITDRSMRRYDRVFRYLLRLLRVQQVTQSMIRASSSRKMTERFVTDAQNMKLRIEMHRFITGLRDYTMSMAIGQPWHRFERYLEEVENSLHPHDGSLDQSSSFHSVPAVRSAHDQTLSSILDSLYLSQKYHQVKDLFDQIFRLILRFSAALRHPPDNENDNKPSTDEHHDDDHYQFYHDFHSMASKICSFLKRQASDASMRTPSLPSSFPSRGGGSYHYKYASSFAVDDGLLAEQLLLRLDYNGHFT